jgi:hypothetical protein
MEAGMWATFRAGFSSPAQQAGDISGILALSL